MRYIMFLIDTQRFEPLHNWLPNIIRWVAGTWNIRDKFSSYRWGDFRTW